jgi:hypothetical protein
MPHIRRRRWRVLIVPASLLCLIAPVFGAELAVFDQITTVGTPATLAVRTTRFFLADGGRTVGMSLNGEVLKPILTGGDGYGYLRLTPGRAGLFQISARSAGRKATGWLLVLEKAERLVLVESETVLQEIHLKPGLRESCRTSLVALRQRYRLVFVNRFLSAGISRSGLEKEGLSPAVVIAWRGAATLENLCGKGVTIHAVIGSAETVKAAGSQVPHRFSFEKARGAKTVAAWEEIAEALE